jgi:antitoxin component YwqK of YwqJK toxin-antitoxin module
MAADMTYVHGDLAGTLREWHENGQLAVQGGFRSGLPDGKATVWHPNGRKAKESTWRDGVQVGVERRWDKNGRPEPVREK